MQLLVAPQVGAREADKPVVCVQGDQMDLVHPLLSLGVRDDILAPPELKDVCSVTSDCSENGSIR